MRDVNRMDNFLNKFKEYWMKVPDWRFMQLICNLQSACGSDMFYMEEDRFLQHLEVYFDAMENENADDI